MNCVCVLTVRRLEVGWIERVESSKSQRMPVNKHQGRLRIHACKPTLLVGETNEREVACQAKTQFLAT